MKALFFIALLVLSPDPIEINRINKTKKAAESAYNAGNYELAASKYKILADSMRITEDEVYLNMAHSYYHLNDSTNATNAYQQLTSSSNKEIRSIAYQQLGVMAKNYQQLNEAESMLKSAIRANPANSEARYNYEIVKKLLQKQNEQNQQNQDNQNQDQQDQNQDQQNQDQQKQNQDKQDQESEQDSQEQQEQEQEQNDQEGKEGEQEQQQQQEGEEQNSEEQENQQPGTREKLEEMNISEEKARMILEAMKNNEFQYIQQRKRKPTKQQDPNRPDW
ncbi:MAG: hypothetical protein KI791_01485 [Cyclobacteriaceae bacterium]|nr:hypothetical protein [Cyclobacteriaceae bacterium SS2]